MSKSAKSSLANEAYLMATSSPDLSVHELGHSSKLWRFTSKSGEEIAIENLVLRPSIYLRRSYADHPGVSGIYSKTATRGPAGRHHHLNGMARFRDEELVVFKPRTILEIQAVLKAAS